MLESHYSAFDVSDLMSDVNKHKPRLPEKLRVAGRPCRGTVCAPRAGHEERATQTRRVGGFQLCVVNFLALIVTGWQNASCHHWD